MLRRINLQLLKMFMVTKPPTITPVDMKTPARRQQLANIYEDAEILYC